MKRLNKILVHILIILLAVLLQSMDLKAQVEQQEKPKVTFRNINQININVAILLFDGVQIIDYTGPYEVFGQAGFNVYTVSDEKKQIITNMGMNVFPSYSLTDMPTPDIIVIPGGEVTNAMANDKLLNWIISEGEKSEKILSVCSGSFLLAKTGLLNGKTATTISGLIEEFKIFAPHTKVVRDKRYVDNGKIITTAGLSAGIDGALHVVETLLGRDYAQMIALNMEYNWDPNTKYARANMADKNLRNIFNLEFCNNLPKTTEIAFIKNIGDYKVWEIKVALNTKASIKELDEYISKIVAGQGWQKSSTEDEWEFNDENNTIWLAHLKFNSSDSTLIVKIEVKEV